MFYQRFAAGVLAMLLVNQPAAQVYKSVDKDGRVTYQSTPPPAANAKPLAISRSHSANPASGVAVPESAIQYYPVYGDSAHALHTSMVQNGPFNQIVQKRVYAEIEWRYKWKFDYQQKSGNCSIKEFVITLVTTITMPQWMNEVNAPPDIRLLWPKVVSKIRKHEDGHKAIAMEGANVLARRLKALPVFDNCQALTNEVNREGDRISREYALANRAFDRTEALKNSPFDD